MTHHRTTLSLPYSAQQMFDLVSDVRCYPEFLPWVIATRIRSDSDREMIADMIVGFKGMRENFTSRVHKQVPHRLYIEYLDGPMQYLHNEWLFSTDRTEVYDSAATSIAGKNMEFREDVSKGCRVDFSIDFAFRSSLFERLAGKMFDHALRRMIAAFEGRAHALYGTQ